MTKASVPAAREKRIVHVSVLLESRTGEVDFVRGWHEQEFDEGVWEQGEQKALKRRA